MSEPRYTKEARNALEAFAIADRLAHQTPTIANLDSMIAAARAFLAATEKGGDCPARPSDKSARWAPVAREVSTTPATEKESAEPVRAKPNVIMDDPLPCYQPGGCKYRAAYAEPVKPQERSAEEILENLLANSPEGRWEWYGVREALAQVRELRAERDELERRIEKAKAVMGPKRPTCCQGCEYEWDEAIRILSGEDR